MAAKSWLSVCLDVLGGEPLEGSGFESELPDPNFVSPLPMNSGDNPSDVGGNDER